MTILMMLSVVFLFLLMIQASDLWQLELAPELESCLQDTADYGRRLIFDFNEFGFSFAQAYC